MKAFHLFDQDKDGLITTEELIKLIDKVGGCMTEGEARGLIRQVGLLGVRILSILYNKVYGDYYKAFDTEEITEVNSGERELFVIKKNI